MSSVTERVEKLQAYYQERGAEELATGLLEMVRSTADTAPVDQRAVVHKLTIEHVSFLIELNDDTEGWLSSYGLDPLKDFLQGECSLDRKHTASVYYELAKFYASRNSLERAYVTMAKAAEMLLTDETTWYPEAPERIG